MGGKPIKNWCICQWAYAKYLAEKHDCANSLTLKCEAVNHAAIEAYTKSDDPTHKAALECLKKKCRRGASSLLK